MVLSKLPVPGHPTYLDWIVVGQGPTILAVGTGGVVWAFFRRLSFFSLLSPSLWEINQTSMIYFFILSYFEL